MLHVYLGRFAPFHEGHKMLLTRLAKKFGMENCLVLIGSSNVLDAHTPFTFETRKKMIRKHFPEVNILPIADMDNDEDWFKAIEKMERKLGQRFVFYGGSRSDLQILSRCFETHVLVNRSTEGKGITATNIRKTLKYTDFDLLR